jgi:mRNA interferase YafQ
MRALETTNKFEKDFVLMKKRGKDIKKLQNVVNMLLKNQPLLKKHKLHLLSGDWENYFECHIEPDWLLIFTISNNAVRLIRTGSHSDLF